MKAQIYYILFCLLFLVSACENSNNVTVPSIIEANYLFLGHIYETPSTIDNRLVHVDYSQYQQIWLGGDICSETTRKESTIDYLDDFFNLGSNTTHWTLGNHDIRNGNIDWITSCTGRKTFYSHHFDGITLLVLNTTFRKPADCEIMDEQMNLIRSITDTISHSSHLIVLTHHAMWGAIDSRVKLSEFSNSDASWVPFECDPVVRFQDVVYPKLIDVQKRGIDVLWISGDLGQKATDYEFTSDEGIVFLGSGISAEIRWNDRFPTCGQQDKVLTLTHDIVDRKITWDFVNIENL